MSRLTRDGTAEPVSRDQILRHAWGQGNIHFPCSADHEQDWQPYQVHPYSAIGHTYIHTYIHILYNIKNVLTIKKVLSSATQRPPFKVQNFCSGANFSSETNLRNVVRLQNNQSLFAIYIYIYIYIYNLEELWSNGP